VPEIRPLTVKSRYQTEMCKGCCEELTVDRDDHDRIVDADHQEGCPFAPEEDTTDTT
jgi:hypothetical protein